MSQLYHDKLLVEVQLSGPVKHHFDEVVKRRMRRSATWSSPSNYKALNDPDHAVTLNIVVWISIAFYTHTIFIFLVLKSSINL